MLEPSLLIQTLWPWAGGAPASEVLAWGALFACATLVAGWVDRRWGEPPVAWHPVVWMGQLLAPAGRWACRQHRPLHAFALGALAWMLGAGLVGALACGVQSAVLWGGQGLSSWLSSMLSSTSLPGDGLAAALAGAGMACLLGLALKPLLSARMLFDEVWAVEQALSGAAAGQSGAASDRGMALDLAAGRAQLARLVSRDVSQLSPAEIRESAIETLAENLNDALVAPLFWWLLLGLPGAAIYRWANTADAMWGYRGRWEWAGKWAARADDVLSWVPARLTAALLRPAWSWSAWAALAREAGKTPSPNGGWPMGAMALRLGIRLSKPGVYVLMPQGRSPRTEDVEQALHGSQRAARYAWCGCAVGFVLVGWAVRAGG